MQQPRTWLFTLTLMSVFLASPLVQAEILGVTSAPKRAVVPIAEGRTINIRWVISTDPAHQKGAASAQGILQDTTTSSMLKTINLPLINPEGSGPIYFEESLALTPDELLHWRELGHRELQYVRKFNSGGDRQTALTATLSISLMTPEAELTEKLVLQDLQLDFKPQRFNPTVVLNLPLHAQLTARYTGFGELTGQWQIARRNEADQTYQFQPLSEASKSLEQEGPSFLLSPRLPTDQLGQYRLRFCPKGDSINTGQQATTDGNCPQTQLNATLSYEVVKKKSMANGQSDQGHEKEPINANAVFEWQVVPNTIVYEMILHRVVAKDAVTSNDYVGRLLIKSTVNKTKLTPELLSRMTPGSQYEWQVNAFDTHGELLKHTEPKKFVFLP